jgi:hypothetical protein
MAQVGIRTATPATFVEVGRDCTAATLVASVALATNIPATSRVEAEDWDYRPFIYYRTD